MEYIELQACPICGAHPEKEVMDLGRPGGHGYPGCYIYHYRCVKCGIVKGQATDDVSIHKTVAQQNARKNWNTEVDRIKGFMEGKNAN